MRILLLGCGYVAQRTALRVPGATVCGTTRDPTRAEALGAHGIAGIVFDGTTVSPALREAADGASHVLVSIPPSPAAEAGLTAVRAALGQSRSLAWLGYLSTTGVYGDRGGGWCFEEEPPTPASARAARRVEAERDWAGAGAAAHVFRLPGIYGPGRSALDRVRAGTARRIVKPGLVFNRAHVDDIAAALAASMALPTPGAVFNVVDDRPAPPQDVTEEAFRLLGRPVPEAIAFEAAGMTGMAAEFYADSKRCSNARLKARLGWRPAYPTYREGLAACLQAEASS